MPTLQGLIRHLRQGTLLSRIGDEYADIRRQQLCKRWHSSGDAGRQIVTEISPGVSLNIYTGDELSYLIYCRGFEQSERQFARHFLKPGDVFIDVGANIGLFTVLASASIGRNGQVYAFEPTTQAFHRLVDNLHQHGRGNIEALPIALSNEPGQLMLHISEDGRDAWNTMGHSSSMGGESVLHKVEAITLDDFVKDRQLEGRLSFVKIDVEGWELSVLKGGKHTLSRDNAPVLQVEFTEEAAKGAGSSCGELYAYLEELGYRLYEYEATANQLTYSPIRDSYPYSNLYAVKDLEKAMQRIHQPIDQSCPLQ